MPLIELASFPDRIGAELARSRLAADGIEAALFDGGFAALGPGTLSAILLMVDEADAGSAREALGL